MTDLSAEKIPSGNGAVIVFIAYDEDDTNVMCKTLTWTMVNENGAVINSRTAVVIAVPALTNNIVLDAADTLYTDGRYRYITINGTYDSATYGNDRPLVERILLEIESITGC